MQRKVRDELVKAFEAELKKLVRNVLEAFMREERAMYLETHPTSANGYYTRDLLTLVGPLGDLKVPYVRENDFHPGILPYRKWDLLELSEALLALYVVSVSTRKIPAFLEEIYGAFYSPQSISRLIKITQEQVKTWRERPLSEEYYAMFLDGTFLSIRRGKTAKEPVYIALGIKPDGRREILGFWLFGAEGESARNAVRDALNKSRKKDREALAEDLKRIYQVESQEEAKEALRSLRERWGGVYSKVVERWETKAYASWRFSVILSTSAATSTSTPPTSWSRSVKEVKEADQSDIFCGGRRCGKAPIPILRQLDEAWARRLWRFAKIEMGNYIQ